MNESEIVIGGKYIFLDWYRCKFGELEPLVEVEVVRIKPEHYADGLLMATSYTMIDSKGIMHYGSAHNLKHLNWIDDRKKPE